MNMFLSKAEKEDTSSKSINPILSEKATGFELVDQILSFKPVNL